MHDYTSALQSCQCALTILIRLFVKVHDSSAKSYGERGLTQANIHDYIPQLFNLFSVHWLSVLNCLEKNIKVLLTATRNSFNKT